MIPYDWKLQSSRDFARWRLMVHRLKYAECPEDRDWLMNMAALAQRDFVIHQALEQNEK